MRWYNNKSVVSKLEAMLNLVEFCHTEGIDMLKLRCTLHNLANISLHSSTSAKHYPLTKRDKNLLSKVREVIFGGPSNVFTGEAVVDETHNRKSANVCKSVVGIDASQFYPFSMCQPMPIGL